MNTRGMNMAGRLQQTYLRMKTESGALSFGGNQSWMGKKRLKQCGCGAVACMDVTTYLKDCANPSSQKQYTALLELFQKQYVPIFPFVGTLGYFMAFGLNRYFKKNDMPFRAHWGTRHNNLWKRMEQMIRDDIPVIFCVGNNFPFPSNRFKLQLYTRKAGEFIPANTVSGHFMVATAIDGEWVQVSSWGKLYYMNRAEYENYVEFHSNWLLNSLMVISRR